MPHDDITVEVDNQTTNVIVAPVDIDLDVSEEVVIVETTTEVITAAITTEIIEVGVGPQGIQGPAGEQGPPGIGGAESVAARARRISDQSVAPGEVTIEFPDEEFDTDNIHSSAINPGRLTCRTAGVYHVTANVTANFLTGDFPTEGYLTLTIYKNGVDAVGTVTEIIYDPEPNPPRNHNLEVSALVDLEVGNWVELKVAHNAGNNCDVRPVSWFGMVRQTSALDEGAGELSEYRAHPASTRESPIVNGTFPLLGHFLFEAGSTYLLEKVIARAETPPVGAGLTLTLFADGIATAVTVTIAAGNNQRTETPDVELTAGVLYQWKSTAAPVSLDDAPSLVSVWSTVKVTPTP